MSSVLIVGPKVSQHIQRWYKYDERIKFDEISLFTIDSGGNDFEQSIKIYKFKILNRMFSFLLAIPVFIVLWWWKRPDVTNFHYLSSYGLFSLFVPKKNLVLNTWGSDVNLIYKSNNILKRWIIKLALRRFIWINVPAEHLKTKLIEMGADPNCIDVFQYGVDTDSLPKKNSSKKENTIRFISNRNWQDLYQIDLIIKGFIRFCELYPDIEHTELFVYGGGTSKEKENINKLVSNAQSQIKHRINIRGYIDRDTMLNEMVQADFFVSIPTRDGTPLSLLESMFIGLYPIVSDIDANREWLNETRAEFINTPSENSICNAFYQAISRDRNEQCLLFNRDIVLDKANLKSNVFVFQNKLLDLSNRKK